MRKSSLVALLVGLFVLAMATSAMAATYSLDFEDGQIGPLTIYGEAKWPVVEDAISGSKALFIEPGYDRTVMTKLGAYVLFPDTYGDFVLEADARYNETESSHAAAVIWGFVDDKNYSYAYYHKSAGVVKLRAVEEGSANDFFKPDGGNFEPADQYFHIKLMRKDGKITAWLNGDVIMEADDPNNLPGAVGLGAWSQSTYFDNVKVYLP